jgi:uncharacterized protein (TIGR03437 family)
VTRRTSLCATLLFSVVCGWAAESDALAINANIQARHLPFGTILDPIFASSSSDQIVGYTRCGDSALWTGHYLAAEAFRYKVTAAPDALANVESAIAGIKSLLDVTGVNFLARCIVPLSSPYAAGIMNEEKTNGIYMASPWFWVGNTSRDQWAGVVFGLGVAFDMVNDPTVKASISDLLTRVIEYPRGHNWVIQEPDGTNNYDFFTRPDFINTFLQVGRHVNPARFNGNTFEENVLLAVPIATPIGVDTGSDNSYFKFNLDYINFYNLVRLDPNTGTTDSRNAYSILRNHTAAHLNAFFDIVDRGLNGPNTARDAETVALLDQWLQRPRRDFYIDLTNTVPVCNILGNNQACQPIPVPLRTPTDFLWQRSPFQLTGGAIGTIETAAIDYVLPNWMARYYGVVSGARVQSAAAASSAVSPDSIASLYGPNLAGTTAQASQQPLPFTLGGVSMTVTDALGAQRQAPLIYVSPPQINFIVPSGTASGTATFTVVNGGSNTSVTGNVQPVAPTLFSMNGNGSGVAAATAIRTQAGNPQLQFPIPVFTCSGSTCTSVPIDVGLDTPVYLTLYGTGIRNRSSLSNVKATIHGIGVPVLYAGPQPSFTGLDQVNMALSLNLRGSGESNVVLTVDGQTSNTVTVNIQ